MDLELEWDGCRAQLRYDARAVSLRTRHGRECSADFPEPGTIAAALGRRRVTLDGELVCLRSDGRADFARLRHRLTGSPTRRHPATISYLDQHEIRALLGAPYRSTWLGRRDHALPLVAVQTGLRVSELVGITVSAVSLGTGANIRLTGKGRKARCAILTAETVARTHSSHCWNDSEYPASHLSRGTFRHWLRSRGEVAMRFRFSILVIAGSLVAAQAASAQPGFMPVPGSPFATASNPQSIAFSASGLAATANTGSNNVSVFSVSSGGALAPVPGSPFATGAAPSSVAFNPGPLAGGLVAVANSGNDTVSVFSQEPGVPGGFLVPVPGSPFATGAAPSSVAFGSTSVDSGGRELLAVTNRGDNTVSVFSRSGGSWTPAPGSPFATGGVGPQSVAFTEISSSNAYFAVANAGSNNVSVFGVNADGSLTGPALVSSGGVNPQALAVGLAPTYAHTFAPVLAVANAGSNSVSVFNFPGMTPVGSPASTGTSPVSVDFAGGQQPLLAVANSGSDNVSVFSVSSSGALAPVTGSPLSLGRGAGPASTAFAPYGVGPNGGLLATANAAANNVSVFTVPDCPTQFTLGFNSGFNSGFNPGWIAQHRGAYRRNGAWQVGWKRGFQAARRRRTVHPSALAALPAVNQGRAAAAPAAVGCDVVFNAAFNQAFNIGFRSGFNSAFNSAFRQGYKAGFAKGKHRT